MKNITKILSVFLAVLTLFLCLTALLSCDLKKNNEKGNEEEKEEEKEPIYYDGEYTAEMYDADTKIVVEGERVTLLGDYVEPVDNVPGIGVVMSTRQVGTGTFDEEKSELTAVLETAEMTIRVEGDVDDQIRDAVIGVYEAMKEGADEKTVSVLDAYIEALRDEKYVDAERFGEEIPETSTVVFTLDLIRMTAVPVTCTDVYPGVDGKTGRSEVTTFDKNGREGKVVTYDENGKELESVRYSYYPGGLISSTTTVNADGKTIASYDSYGNLVSETSYWPNEQIKSRTTVDGTSSKCTEYYENGKTQRVSAYYKGELEAVVTYDENGVMLEERRYSTDGSYTVILYDENGVMIGAVLYDKDGNPIE